MTILKSLGSEPCKIKNHAGTFLSVIGIELRNSQGLFSGRGFVWLNLVKWQRQRINKKVICKIKEQLYLVEWAIFLLLQSHLI